HADHNKTDASASQAAQPAAGEFATSAGPVIVPVTTQETRSETPEMPGEARAETRTGRNVRNTRRGGRGRGSRQPELILRPTEQSAATPIAEEAQAPQAADERATQASDLLSDLFAQAPDLIAQEPARPYAPLIPLGEPEGKAPAASATEEAPKQVPVTTAEATPPPPRRYRFDSRPRGGAPQPAARPTPTPPQPIVPAPAASETVAPTGAPMASVTPVAAEPGEEVAASAPEETSAELQTLEGVGAAEITEDVEGAETAEAGDEGLSLLTRGSGRHGRRRSRRRTSRPTDAEEIGAEEGPTPQPASVDEAMASEAATSRYADAQAIAAPTETPIAPSEEQRPLRRGRSTAPAASAPYTPSTPDEGDGYLSGYAPASGYGQQGYVPGGYSGYASANNGAGSYSAAEANAYGRQEAVSPTSYAPSYGAPYTPGARAQRGGVGAAGAEGAPASTASSAQSPYGSPEPAYARGFAPQPRPSVAATRSDLYTPATRNGRSNGETAQVVSQLNSAVREVRETFQQQTDRLLTEMRRQQMSPAMTVNFPPMPSNERVGVFVDVANLVYSARSLRIEMDFGRLLNFLHGNRRLIRAHAYAPTSPDGIEQSFLPAVKGLGYRITTKNYKTFASGAKKADLDLDMCMDVVRLVEAGALDTVVLVSGDSDFLPLLEYCSDHGVRVEVAAFDDSAALILRQSCDLFINLSLLDEIRV
ncbi:MAG TPA: NYN domain-containing protein, partial [Ktedonobacterales bacterium]|nr:NYN domain-containing protein [Ktedonobacterales bacterium]